MHTLHLLNVPDHAAPYPPKQLTAQFIFHIFKSSCKCRRISVHTGRCHPDGTCSGDLSDKNKLLLVHRILLVFHTLPKSFLRLILPYIIPTSQTCKKQAHLPVAKEYACFSFTCLTTPFYFATALNASSRSWMISSIFSVPMERRMVFL